MQHSFILIWPYLEIIVFIAYISQLKHTCAAIKWVMGLKSVLTFVLDALTGTVLFLAKKKK